MVLDAYAGFDPRMARYAALFFDKGLDRRRRKPGQGAGAFAHSTVTECTLTCAKLSGKPRDVSLAHELVHACTGSWPAGQGECCHPTAADTAPNRSVFARC